MPGLIQSHFLAKSKTKTKTCVVVSVLACVSLQGCLVSKVHAWPAVLPQVKSEEKIVENALEKSAEKSQETSKEKSLEGQKSGESRFSKGIQKTLAEGHYRLGLRLKKKKQWEEALTQFLEATNKNPNHFKSFFEQALIYRQKQIHDMAVTCLQQALTIKPKYKDARVLLATLQLEKGNIGSAFEQLKESLGMSLDEKSKDDSGKDSDTILQTIHTFIETSQMVASVVAPAMAPLPAQIEKNAIPAPTAEPAAVTVAEAQITSAVVPAGKQSLVFTSESQPDPKPNSKRDAVIDHKTLPVLLAQQAVLVNTSYTGKNAKNSTRKNNVSKQAKSIAVKPDEDEWTSKLRFLAKNGTGTLKAGEAFFFTEDTGEAILILADGKRIARMVDTPKDREAVVQMRRPDILVPDDLLYNLSLLGKVVAEKVTSPLDAPGAMGDKTSDSMSGYASQATRQASETMMQEKTPPSFKLESGRQDNLGESLEPRRMVHWLKDVFHM